MSEHEPPSDPEDIIDFSFALDPYATAVGRLNYQWNLLQESLGEIFASVSGMGSTVGMAVWYSTQSDRAQIAMLEAALNASDDDRWMGRLVSGRDDLLWLTKTWKSLSDQRNDAIHGPVNLTIDLRPERRAEWAQVMPHYFLGNPRAKNLMGKNLLAELGWYEARADVLRRYANIIVAALKATIPWPERPKLPSPNQTGSQRKTLA